MPSLARLFTVLVLSFTLFGNVLSVPQAEGSALELREISYSGDADLHIMEKRQRGRRPAARPAPRPRPVAKRPVAKKAVAKKAVAKKAVVKKAAKKAVVKKVAKKAVKTVAPKKAAKKTVVAKKAPAKKAVAKKVVAPKKAAAKKAVAKKAVPKKAAKKAAAKKAPVKAASCPIKKNAKGAAKKSAGIRRALASLIFGENNIAARGVPLKTGDCLTLAGNTANLGRTVTSASRGSGTTIVFEVNWKGTPAFAKQQTTISNAAFDAEVDATRRAGGLLLDAGTFIDSKWMVVRKVNGKPFFLTSAFQAAQADGAACRALVIKARGLAVEAQVALATRAQFVQGDDNAENFLFDEQITRCDIIDFGVIAQTRGASADQTRASQETNLSQSTFNPEFFCPPA